MSYYYYRFDVYAYVYTCCSKEFLVALLRRGTFDSHCFAAVRRWRIHALHNLKTYYVITTIEKSEKFVGGGMHRGGSKTVVF